MTTLVTGATGNVGRHLIDRLLAAGEPVRALTRRPDTAQLPAAAAAVKGDLTVPDSLGSALSGVTALHLITAVDDEATLSTGQQVVRLAEAAGVRRATVLWSGVKGPVEAAVEASSLEWTILQPVEFMSNSLEWAESIRVDGVVREAFPDTLNAAVHEADIADVAAEVLTAGGHHGRSYTLTGPQALSLHDKLRLMRAELGRDIRLVELSRQQARERMRAETGASDELIDFVIGWYADPPQWGYTVSPAVEQVVGRPPRDFAGWIAEHAAAFRG